MAANAVRKQLRDLRHKIGSTFQPVFVSKKLGQDLGLKEIKQLIEHKQCVVYHYSVICAMQIIGYTAGHLHQRIAVGGTGRSEPSASRTLLSHFPYLHLPAPALFSPGPVPYKLGDLSPVYTTIFLARCPFEFGPGA